MRSSLPYVLGIDDDPRSGRLLRAVLEGGGFEVALSESAVGIVARIRQRRPDAVVLDLRMPTLDGREALRQILAAEPTLPVLILTADSDVSTAVECIQLGAFDYLTKPLDPDALLLRVRHAVERDRLLGELGTLRRLTTGDGGLAEAMGGSAVVRALVQEVQRVADSGLTVLIQGETGTGKELVARALHTLSSRRAGPFVAIDCGAIAENLLESELFGHERGAFTGAHHKQEGLLQRASGGTVLLDEVGNLPTRLQAKLLRVLQERQLLPVGAKQPIDLDVRVLAATNDALDPKETAAFRSDLYFRLAEYSLQVPTLRSRPEDIPYLSDRFLTAGGWRGRTFSPAALAQLAQHRWPGNVRQLRNVVRQAAVSVESTVIEARHLRLGDAGPVASPREGRSLREIAEAAVRDAEMAAIQGALRAAGGNRAEAARALQVDYKTLYVKLKKYRID